MIATGDLDDYEYDVGGIVVVAYDFEAEHEDELNVEEGTRLRTLERKEEWWFAETQDGSQQGLIPASYVVTEAEWQELNSFDVDDAALDDIPDYQDDAAVAAEEEEPPSVVAPPRLDETIPSAKALTPPPAEGKSLVSEQAAAAAAAAQPPSPPPPQVAEAALAKQMKEQQVTDVEYEDLASKFQELQRRVASVKLTDDRPPSASSSSSSPPPPPSPQAAAAALETRSPPPPSPSQAAATFSKQQQEQIAAAIANQAPPPPSPMHAQEQFLAQERQRLEAERRALEEERRRIAENEELSKRRAAEMRAKREEEMARRSQARQQSQADAESYDRFAHQRRNTQERGRAAMQNAIAAVKAAVSADNQGKKMQAYGNYIRSLELFSNVLRSGVNRPQYPTIADRMRGYLNRMSELEPSICKGVWSDGEPRGAGHRDIPRFKDRVKILVVMAKVANFDLLAPAEELQLKGRFAESTDDYRKAFRKYSEGIEYSMAHRQLMKELGKPTAPVVMENIKTMLGKAESLKLKIG